MSVLTFIMRYTIIRSAEWSTSRITGLFWAREIDGWVTKSLTSKEFIFPMTFYVYEDI